MLNLPNFFPFCALKLIALVCRLITSWHTLKECEGQSEKGKLWQKNAHLRCNFHEIKLKCHNKRFTRKYFRKYAALKHLLLSTKWWAILEESTNGNGNLKKFYFQLKIFYKHWHVRGISSHNPICGEGAWDSGLQLILHSANCNYEKH